MNSAQYLREMYASVYNESLQEDRDGYGDDSKFKQDTDAKKFRPGKDVPKVKKYGRISRAMPASISGHATRTISANTRAAGGDAGAPRSQKIAQTKKMVKKDGKWVKSEGVDLYDLILSHLLDEASKADDTTRANIARYAGKKGISFEPGPNWDPSANRGKGAHLNPKQKEKQRRKALRSEETDIYDIILAHLIDEGFASTQEAAEGIMINMSEEWRTSIISTLFED
jgi:hypothetical protein